MFGARLLSVRAYEDAEKQAIEVLPNRIIEAFQPEAFNFVGYPTRIRSRRELPRYADVMHETGFPGILELFLRGLTDEEFALLKKITAAAYRLTQRHGRPVVARSALLWAFLAMRHLRSIAAPGATILELGPGSGYLACLCGLLGYRYIGMDVAQGFYLYQNALWSEMFGRDFSELAQDNYDLNRLPDRKVTHVPWWKFVSTNPRNINLDVDCIVCVDMITEMHVFAMRYLGRQAVRWLNKKSGAMYIQGTGAQLKIPIVDVLGALGLMGLHLSYSDKMELPEKYAPHDLFYFLTTSPSNIRETVLAGRAGVKGTVGTEEVRAFHKQLSGMQDNSTDDERFWDFCNGEEWSWYKPDGANAQP